MKLEGTKTEQNLRDAFALESRCRNKYTYYASVAKKEGLEKISSIFESIAQNKKEHAKLHLKLISGIGTTPENLRAAAESELSEYSEIYPEMALQARTDGFSEIAFLFEQLAKIKKHHYELCKRLMMELEGGTFFTKGEAVFWKCLECGHIHEGPAAPLICPVCKHPQGYFEPYSEYY
jgi:rubrerythrin